MKKLIALILAAVMAFSFTACGKEEKPAPATNSPETTVSPDELANEPTLGTTTVATEPVTEVTTEATTVTEATTEATAEAIDLASLAQQAAIEYMVASQRLYTEENILFNSDYSKIPVNYVFMFIYYFADVDEYTVPHPNGQFEWETQTDIPVSVLNEYALNIFGHQYNFAESDSYIAETDCVRYELLGGFGGGPNDAYEFASCEANGTTAYAKFNFVTYNQETYEATGIDHTATMTLEYLENGAWRIISFAKD